MTPCAPEQFTLRSERCDGLTVLTMAGCVGAASVSDLSVRLSVAIGPATSTVVVDLRDVTDVEPFGVGALRWVERWLADNGRELLLHAPSGRVFAALRGAGISSPPAPSERSSLRRL